MLKATAPRRSANLPTPGTAMRTPTAAGFAVPSLLLALGLLVSTERGAAAQLHLAVSDIDAPAPMLAEVAERAGVPSDGAAFGGVDPDPALALRALVDARLAEDYRAIQAFRPGYTFWRHVFTIPDGSIAFGSATDGSLLAVFPDRGNWNGNGQFQDVRLASFVNGRPLPNGMTQRREEMARLLEPAAGPVIHNATRGRFVSPNVRRYGSFLQEWGLIYERFGVPAEIGLAQAMVESGFHPTIRSEARALGFCQWLESNWNRMKRLAPNEIEGHNQTTQAAYCAAYMAVLSAKYDSYIPALSEHHAGGTNVGRVLVMGERLGGRDVREQYLLGSDFALGVRELPGNRYSPLVRTYGPRSHRYAELTFGNAEHVLDLMASIPQDRIHAMRAPRSIPIEEVARVSGLSVDEVRRYNPALIRQVPRSANVYLPMHVPAFGEDVAFWHHPPSPAFASLLQEFLSIGLPPERWDEPVFEGTLRSWRDRFAATGTEEGAIMATVIAFVMQESFGNSRGQILADYRTDPQILRLHEQGVRDLERVRMPVAAVQEDE